MRKAAVWMTVWLAVGVVLGGAGPAARETPPAATDREAMERTLAAMRDLGAAWLTWLVDTLTVEDFSRSEWLEEPEGWVAPRVVASGYYDLGKLPVRFTADELEEVLRELLPAERVDGLVWEDGWGRPFELFFSGYVLAPQVMAIRSAGRDGEPSGTIYGIGPVAADPEQDIVWADGFYIRYPEWLRRE